MGQTRYSRRKFLTAALLGGVAIHIPGARAEMRGAGIPWIAGTSPAPRTHDGARFFAPSELRCVEALVARLIPSDETGPGAREAGVADFIDNQLAGSFGRGERWYMRGPFGDGLETQGYQSELPPAALYRLAIAELDAHSRRTHDDRAFAELTDDEQDLLLTELEDGRLALEGVDPKAFFELLMENAIEGFFCDPIYGGNRDMTGWKLVGFPGVRYDYRDYLDHDGAEVLLDPVGLAGRPAWNLD